MTALTHKRPPLATLGIFADRLDPSAVDRVLSTHASVSARKGEILRAKTNGRQVPAKTGTWFRTTEDLHLGSEPADHLQWLVNLVQTHFADLKDAVPDVEVDLSLLVFDKSFEPSALPKDLLRSAVTLGTLEIEIPNKPADFQINASNVHQYMS